MRKLLLFLAITIQFVNAQESRIYYIDYSKTINSVSLNGEDDKVVLTSFNNPIDIAFYNDKLYVSDDNFLNRNYRFNPDGTSGEILHDETDGAIEPSSVSGYNNELYFIDNNFIRKSDINGGNVVDVLSLTSTPISAKLQVIDNKIYWNAGSALRSVNIDGTGETAINNNGNTFRGFWVEGDEIFYIVDDSIKKSFIDGSNEITLLTSSSPNVSSPIDLTVFNGKLYYTDTGLDQILRSDLDGSNVELVYDIPGLANPVAIAGHNGFIYWSDNINQAEKISRISSSLTNFEVVLGDEFTGVDDLAFHNDELIFSRNYIKKSTLDGGTISALSPDNEFIDEIRVSEDEIFFSFANQASAIMKTSINTYNPQEIVGIQSSSFISSFDIGGDFIYWIENDSDMGTVYKAFIDGTNIQTIYTDTAPLFNIEFYNNKLYWVRSNAQNILIQSNTDGTNLQTVLSVTGSINNFDLYNELVYFGLTRPDGTKALATIEIDGNVDGSNAIILRELPSTITDIQIYEPENTSSTVDYDALVALYNSTNGANWTNTWDLDANISTFFGVTLDANNRVSSIVLNNNNLVGTLPTELGNLSELESLFLPDNQLNGNIPFELGNLTNLTQLYLNNNNFTGVIPTQLGNLLNLEKLFLSDNQLSGNIPTEIGNLNSLTDLFLNNNNLTGIIPSQFADLSGLNALFLSDNQLTGDFPIDITIITGLEQLFLNNNNLTGSIPNEIGNLNQLLQLFLGGNNFSGNIPSTIGNLSSLQALQLANNSLTGSIPSSLTDLNNLIDLDLKINQLTGSIPGEIGNLNNLESLELDSNQLVGAIPASIGNLTSLTTLSLSFNQLTGVPSEIGNLPNILSINLLSNDFVGSIPSEMGNLTSLVELILSNNNFSGTIPTEMGSLVNLEQLYLSNNNLSGQIPAAIGSLVNLTILSLRDNNLVGEIPIEIGNLSNLFNLNLRNNQLEGIIPAELGNLTNLRFFEIQDNKISGISETLNLLNNLVLVDISNNDLVFLEIETIFTQYQTIANFTYAPQNKFGLVETIDVNFGMPILLSSLFADAVTANNTYQWFKDDLAIAGAINPSLEIASATEDDAGVYVLKVNNPFITDLELESEPITVNVIDPLGLQHNLSNHTIKMYPSPADDFVNLTINNTYSGIVDLHLYDITGKLVYSNQVEKTENNFYTKINVSKLTNGVYILTIKTQDSSIDKRIIISQ